MGGLMSLFGGGGGGFSGSSEANSSTGAVTLGGFHFQPKGSNSSIPTAGWLAMAAIAVVLLLKR